MRHWLGGRRVNGDERIEQVGQADSLSLRNEPEQGAVSVDTPRSYWFDDLEARFDVTVQELIRNLTGRCLVGQLKGVRAEPLDRDERDEAVGEDAADGSVWLQACEFGQQHHPVWCNSLA